MNTLPSYTLELRAADQRRRLQSSLSELRSRLRESFDIKKRNELFRSPLVSTLVASFVVLLARTRVLLRSHGCKNTMTPAGSLGENSRTMSSEVVVESRPQR